ncbi:MAG: GNAT family N-acetyltransferase [Actinobacteria bacterium]|nr:MAG: GNAT family N-acetyltransferase [Actinomycetota bacterium]TMM09606.1 MAG: GNAT family N-acetyltransferase [Actinomycetota bacterium]
MADHELRGERLRLRHVTEADLGALVAILQEPAVARWWGRYDADRARREMLEDPQVEAFVIELDGEVAGVLYVSEENEPDYRHAGLDISLATAHQGHGYGREALRVAIDHLVRERGHHRFTIDPAADNEVAIRSYAAVGFKPVGVLRRYERAPDGTWRDGLLMDLLADELP